MSYRFFSSFSAGWNYVFGGEMIDLEMEMKELGRY